MLFARDIMIRNVYTAHRDDKVQTVLEKFAQYRISGMPLVDDSNHIVGYISDGDIMRYLGKHVDTSVTSWIGAVGFYYGAAMNDDAYNRVNFDELKENVQDVCQKTAGQVGVRRVITIDEDDNLVDVADTLSRRKIKKVPVTKNGILTGIVSRGDVVRAVVQKVLTLDNVEDERKPS
ncbi:CBS domain-containing protein [Alicyclobacillus sp. SO9]|uniref:CBS domain-containing protein n=1 Tax=Alicyclobacillus sp. SO9 TaxID=2665646 RepID=UPI0018E85A4A|nr:CBS domain-containing protein [Alicyclobacillus sp. SO9]QQE80136.1 CBS domain-containing protein [Alicyclobacillus sp. SO9]